MISDELFCGYSKKGKRRRWRAAKYNMTQFYRMFHNRIANDIDI